MELIDIDMDVIPRETTPPPDDCPRKENATVMCISKGQLQEFLVLHTVVVVGEIFFVLA